LAFRAIVRDGSVSANYSFYKARPASSAPDFT